jgi:hypothetical protein
MDLDTYSALDHAHVVILERLAAAEHAALIRQAHAAAGAHRGPRQRLASALRVLAFNLDPLVTSPC